MSLIGCRKIPIISGGGISGGGLSLLQQVIALSPTVLYDISQLNTLFEERTGASATTPASVDGVVGTIKDLSGNGNHATASSDAARGILRQSGDLYSIEIDGTDDQYVLSSSISITESMSAGHSFLRQAAWTPNPGFGHTVNGQPHSAYWYISNDIYTALRSSGNILTSGGTGTGNFILVSTRSASTEKIRRDGTEILSGTQGAVGGALDVFGRREAQFGTGKLYGGVVFDYELTGADLDLVEQWLASLNGVSL